MRAEVTLYERYASSYSSEFSYVLGWIASPVPAYQIVSVIVQAVNPEDQLGLDAFDLPRLLGIATQTGPTSPNGALLFTGDTHPWPDSPWGVTIWYLE